MFAYPLKSYRPLGSFLALVVVGLLDCTQAAEAGKARVELYCRLVPDPGESGYKTWTVELQSSAGEILDRSAKSTGDTVRFKRLVPAIYLICVSGEKGRSRCESVDLFLPSGREAHRFTKDFNLPKPVLNDPDAHKISSARLAVPLRARREVARSQECRMRGENSEAMLHLERALAIYPKYAEALNNMGAYYHRAGEYEKAIRCFRKITQLDSEFYLGWLNLGGSLLANGQPQEALDAQLRALALRPEDTMANALAAMSYFRLRRLEEAKERFLKVAELDPVSASFPHFYLALISMARNETAEADGYIRTYLEIHPNSPRSPYLRKTLDNLRASTMFQRAASLNGQPQ